LKTSCTHLLFAIESVLFLTKHLTNSIQINHG
jgi:hypothetical protein